MKAVINHINLEKARKRVNLSIDDAARKLGIKNPEKLVMAESGEDQITFVQLEKAAKAYDIPIGYFYLDVFPLEEINIVDFRLNPDYYGRPKSYALKKSLFTAIEKRNDILEIADQLNYKIPELTTAITLDDDIEFAGKKIRALFSDNCFGDKSKVLNRLQERIEQLGIFVFGVGDSHHKISHDEFDGAAIYFKKLPIMLLNLSDKPKAKNRIVFTMFHELTHLLLHNSVITDFYFSIGKHINKNVKRTEVFCNNVAAAALLPPEKVIVEFDGTNIVDIADKYRVSKYVVAIRLKNLRQISQFECDQYLDEFKKEYDSRKKHKFAEGAVIDPNMFKRRNLGKLYISYIRDAVASNSINYLDAMRMLGMKDKAARKILYGD